MSPRHAFVLLLLTSAVVILQRDVLFHPELENSLKATLNEFMYTDANGQQISYRDIQETKTLWKWIECAIASVYDVDQPITDSWSLRSLNGTRIKVPMTMRPIRAINAISAVYIGRARMNVQPNLGLLGGINSKVWDDHESATVTHTDYNMHFLEEDTDTEKLAIDMDEPTASQVFILNGIPHRKTKSLITQLKKNTWINDYDTESVFFKLNVYNPNLKRLAQVLVVWSRDDTGSFEHYVVTSAAPDQGFYIFSWDSITYLKMMQWACEVLFLLFIFQAASAKLFQILKHGFNILDLEMFCVLSMIYHVIVWLMMNHYAGTYRERLSASYKNMILSPSEQFSARAVMKSLYQDCDVTIKCPGNVFGILNGSSPHRLSFIRSATMTLLLQCTLVFARIPAKSHLALIPNILRKSAHELLMIGILLVLLFSVYATVGSLLFAHSSSNFETLGQSFNTCIEMALGDNIELSEMEKAFADNPTITGRSAVLSSMILPRLYKWSFQILFMFILINIFVAVVTAAYEEVTKEAEQNENLQYMARLKKFLQAIRLVPHEKKE